MSASEILMHSKDANSWTLAKADYLLVDCLLLHCSCPSSVWILMSASEILLYAKEADSPCAKASMTPLWPEAPVRGLNRCT